MATTYNNLYLDVRRRLREAGGEGAQLVRAGRRQLVRLSGSGVRRLTRSLVDGGRLSREDLAGLRDYLDHLEVE